MSHINETLDQRGQLYGDFSEHARITQEIKEAMARSKNWETLSNDKKEALEMVAHKIGRILNGDPDYAYSWHDIAGYATLVEKKLNAADDNDGDGKCIIVIKDPIPHYGVSRIIDHFKKMFNKNRKRIKNAD